MAEGESLSYCNDELESDKLGRRLIASCDEGDVEEVKYLLQHKEKDSFIQEYGESAIFKAAKRGNFEIAQLLVRHGAVVDSGSRWSYSSREVELISVATEHGHTEITAEIEPGSRRRIGHSDGIIISQGMSALMIASMNGSTEIARLFLENGADVHVQSTVSTRGEKKVWTALMFACRNGQTQTVKLLLEYKSEVCVQPQFDFYTTELETASALVVASEYRHLETAKVLLEHGADVDVESETDTALMVASKNGDNKMIELLLKHGAKVNLQTKVNKWTALMCASDSGHTESAKLLLDHGADADIQGFEKLDKEQNVTLTALMVACRKGYTEIVKLLLEHKASMNMKNNEGTSALMVTNVNLQAESNKWTALIFACDCGHTESAKLLLKHGANVDIQGYEKQDEHRKVTLTALMVASRKGYTEMAKLLLVHKASINMKNNEGMTALMFATAKKNHETVELLLEHGADTNIQNNEGMTALMIATKNEKHETVKLLLEHEADTNIQNNEGMTALMFASQNGHLEMTKTLLEYESNVNAQNKKGWSALMFVSEKGHTELFNLLLEHGADISIKERSGWTAIIIASKKGHSEIIKLLPKYPKSDVIKIFKNEKTDALINAAENGHTETVQVLLAKDHHDGADVNLQNNEGSTALMSAAKNGHSETAQVLLNSGANVDLQNNEGMTALMSAAKNGRSETARVLLNSGANVDLQNNEGMSALMASAHNGHRETIKLLLEKKATINLQKNNGWTALMFLISGFKKHPDHELVQLLLDKGANKSINLQGRDGWTALILACNNRYTKVAKLLLNHGADVNIQNPDGLTALMIASRNGDTNTVKLLREHRADGKSASMIADDRDLAKLLEKKESTLSDIIHHTTPTPVKLLSEHRADGKSASMIADDQDLAKLLGKKESTLSDIIHHTTPTPVKLLREHRADGKSASMIADDQDLAKLLENKESTLSDIIHHTTPTPEDLTAETSIVVTNSEQHFTWHEYGLSIHIPKNSLPEGVQQCSIHIKASLAVEGLQLPQDTHLVSAVYSFECNPKGQFSKYLTLAIQHCAKLDNNKTLWFVRSTRGSNFQVIQSGDQNVLKCQLPQHSSYGFVELNNFCKWSIAQKGASNRRYCANLYRSKVNSTRHNFFFNIHWDTKAHKKIVTKYLKKKKLRLVFEKDQVIEFEESQIQLDIPFPSIPNQGIKPSSNDAWRIQALTPPYINKEHVDCLGSKGCLIPSCLLEAQCKNTEPTELYHPVKLNGAKSPYNYVVINVYASTPSPVDDCRENKPDKPIYMNYEEYQKEFPGCKSPIPAEDDLLVKSYLEEVVVLLHTVKDEERWAALHHLSPPLEQSNKAIRWFDDNVSFTLGTFGNHKAALIQTRKGSDCQHQLLPAVRYLPKVKLIIVLGFAYGLRSNCELGDVLVSTTVDGIGNTRFVNNRLKFDDCRVRYTSMSTNALDVFTMNSIDWKSFTCSKEGRLSKVVTGLIVSSPSLINDKRILDEYLKNNERSKGGEMEGQEVAHAQLKLREIDKRDIDFIVIKGVADFGDGTKEKGWQLTASLAAARYADEKLRETNNKVYKLNDSTNAEQKGPITSTPQEPEDRRKTDIPNQGQKHPTLEIDLVVNELSSEVAARWKSIGTSLNIKSGQLAIIKADNPSDCQECFREMIKVWFRQQVHPPPSWSAIVEALRKSDHNSLAQTLKDKYQI